MIKDDTQDPFSVENIESKLEESFAENRRHHALECASRVWADRSTVGGSDYLPTAVINTAREFEKYLKGEQ